MTGNREEIIDWVAGLLDQVQPGQFLLVEYLTENDLPVEPYAQAALGPSGWYCEIVSNRHLPARQWPLDELVLVRDGWHGPCRTTDNWWRPEVSSDSAAGVLVDALWLARACTDPDAYAVSIGTFPPGPGRGEPLPVPYDLPLVA